MIVTLVGASGSGKSYLESKLCEDDRFRKVISVTTRQKRKGEIEGKDYFFITKEEFEKKDLAERISFDGNFYGVEKSQLQDTDKIPVVVVEPNGLFQIAEHFKDIYVVLLDIDKEKRIQGMKERGDSDESVEKRLISDKKIIKFFDEISEDKRFRVKKINKRLTPEEINELKEEIIDFYFKLR